AADLVEKTLQQRLALQGVRHLGMELHAVEAALFVRHAGDRAGGRGSHQAEARRHLDDLVAMAHPYLEQAMALGGAHVLDTVEQPGMSARPHLGIAELAYLASLHAAPKLLRHGLHAVADPEDRRPGLEHRLRR